MCGILGIYGDGLQPYTHQVVDTMLSSLSFRGPDERGSYYTPQCILGHTRLSIIDLSSGQQPMRDDVHDLTIVFNGEIYNFRELKSTFQKKGHHFKTNSDTEVILKSYIEYGDECPKYLDGMFAFAIWDNKKKHLLLARDRFGKKPLYFASDTIGNIVFASEIKAIFQGGIKGVVDLNAVDNYLSYLYIPPTKSIYSNVHVVPSGHIITLDNGQLTTTPYWQLSKQTMNMSYEQSKQDVRDLLEHAIQKRLIADVPLGVMLSGGIDSTLIAYIAQQNSTTPIQTFSVGFEDAINELPFARVAAKTIGTNHHELQMSMDIASELEYIMGHLDEPNADASIIPTFLISKYARAHVKVLLSGDGADELFLGYGWYTKQWCLGLKARIRQTMFSDPFRDHMNMITYFNPRERKQLWKDVSAVHEYLPEVLKTDTQLSYLEQINLYDLTTYMPGDLLSKVDRMSMLASLEVRSPFLDHHVAELVYSLPTEHKLKFISKGKWEHKTMLKDFVSEFMSDDFVHRRKQGFGPPLVHWLKKPEIKDLIYTIFGTSAHIYDIMYEKEIQTYIHRFYNEQDESVNLKIWILLCLELWFRSHHQYHA